MSKQLASKLLETDEAVSDVCRCHDHLRACQPDKIDENGPVSETADYAAIWAPAFAEAVSRLGECLRDEGVYQALKNANADAVEYAGVHAQSHTEIFYRIMRGVITAINRQVELARAAAKLQRARRAAAAKKQKRKRPKSAEAKPCP